MENNVTHHNTLESGYDFYCTDKWQKKHHFKISTFSLGIKMLSEAIEVINPEKGKIPRVFHVLSDYDPDEEKAELLLKAKIMKWLNQKHLKIEDGRLTLTEQNEIKGTIDGSSETSDTNFETVFEVDGKELTVEEFVQLLEPYAAYKFRFQIIDSSEDFD